MIAQDLGLDHVARLHPVETVRKRDPRAGNRRGASAAVGLDHVAVDRDLPFAECRQINHRTKRAPNEPLNLDGAATLLSGARLASRALRGGAREHAVFGGYPTAALALEPWRQALLEACRHQHVGVAKLNKTGAFGVFHNPTIERDRAQLIGLSAAWPHRACSPNILAAHHNYTPGLNKTAAVVKCCLAFEE